MDDYSIWVLEYCYREKHPVGSVLYGHFNAGTLRLPFSYTLVRGNGLNILVDCGHNDKDQGATFTKAFDLQNWKSPRDVLGTCGLTPEDITHVILTHGHFDHMGATDEFPNAQLLIQERELQRWIWAMALNRRMRWISEATDPGDILRVVEAARRGRLTLIKGAAESILPGLDLHPAYDSHTAGSQYVVINNNGRKWILAGDLVYQYENMVGWSPNDPMYIPVGYSQESQANGVVAIEDMMSRVDYDMRQIIPGHEDRLGKDFPSRVSKVGLRVTEINLARSQTSLVA
jgi:N-acyl homoserine lactone hydrolase